MTGSAKSVVVGWWWLLAAAATGCGSEAPDRGVPVVPGAEAAAETAESAVPSGLPAPLVRESATARAQVAAELPDALTALVLERAWAEAMPRQLTDTSALNLPSYRREVLEPLYRERGFRPVFAGVAGGLSGRAEVLFSELRATHQHALDSTPYRLADLNRLEPLVVEAEPMRWEWPLDAAGLDALVASLDALEAPTVVGLAQLAAGLEGEPPVPALAEAFGARVEEARRGLRDEVDLELIAAHAFLSYAFDMRHFNTDRLSAQELAAAGGPREVQREALRTSFRAAAEATPEALAAELEALYPPHEQYARLMTSLARYRDIVEGGGWPNLSARSLEAGDHQPRVGELKRRLQIEGFYDGPINNSYDAALVEAVRSYQESHQMQVTGATHDMFWRSLNVPADRRLAQIEVTLQRWRETRMDDEDYYVFVNVPDFHAEVWRDGERQLRFRIVVGNTDTECNPTTGHLEYVNATPVQRAEIEYMVFNPYWNVPTRIREDELDLELVNNPTWLQENGYEVVVLPSGPRIRQLPGPENALGGVKFIFPNIHNTYMHDTPRQRYFDFPIRNYSHGCMRVQNPMDYAELLLTNDGQWDPARIERIRESGVETTIHLEQHVPIFIEYYVVRVDELGRTHFLSDVYRYDRERLENYEPPTCTVPVADLTQTPASPAIVWNPDGTAVTADGTVIHPDGRVDYSPARVATTGGGGVTDSAPVDNVRRLQRRTVEDSDEGVQPEAGDYGP